MRLFRCRLFSTRRRRASLITQTLGLMLLIVIACWAVILVLQAGHESLAFSKSHQPVAADYDMFRTNLKHSRHSSSSNSSGPNELVQNPIMNGRQPKGIALPVMERKNISTVNTFHSSPSSSSPSSPPSTSSPEAAIGGQNITKPSQDTSDNVSSKPKVGEQITIDALPSQIGPDSLQLLKEHMFKLNREQRVLNNDKFPPLANDGLVFIVQVHRREGYLRQLFNSMRKVRGIEDVLLVISHDYYYDDMMHLVQTVDFCRVCMSVYILPLLSLSPTQ